MYSWYCDFSNIVVFGLNELYRPPALNDVTVPTQMLWHLATSNCCSRRKLILSMLMAILHIMATYKPLLVRDTFFLVTHHCVSTSAPWTPGLFAMFLPLLSPHVEEGRGGHWTEKTSKIWSKLTIFVVFLTLWAFTMNWMNILTWIL